MTPWHFWVLLTWYLFRKKLIFVVTLFVLVQYLIVEGMNTYSFRLGEALLLQSLLQLAR
jgi:hypothetical protein